MKPFNWPEACHQLLQDRIRLFNIQEPDLKPVPNPFWKPYELYPAAAELDALLKDYNS